MLVRTWNLFQGNALPPERDGYVEEMVRLASGDQPQVLCLQEVPVWALERLGEWSGMTVYGEVASRPRIGPFPSTAEIGRALTEIDHGRIRSAFAGQGNAILIAPGLDSLDFGRLVLNDRAFRKAQAERLGLDFVARLAWAKERRVCHAVRLRLRDGRGALIVNFHATGLPDDRIPDAEVFRAASFADGLALPAEICVLAGDFNVWPDRSRTLAELAGQEWGFSEPGKGLDQVLVRGAETDQSRAWPTERRRVQGRLLSDHAPVDARIQ